MIKNLMPRELLSYIKTSNFKKISEVVQNNGIEYQYSGGSSALVMACRLDNIDVVWELILTHKADINKNHGEALSSNLDNLEITEFLLLNGADPDLSIIAVPPLACYSAGGNMKGVELLLKYKANVFSFEHSALFSSIFNSEECFFRIASFYRVEDIVDLIEKEKFEHVEEKQVVSSLLKKLIIKNKMKENFG